MVLVVLVAAILLNATGMAAAGLALWRDTRANRAVERALDYGGPSLLGEAGALLLNLFLFVVDVWRLAATE